MRKMESDDKLKGQSFIPGQLQYGGGIKSVMVRSVHYKGEEVVRSQVLEIIMTFLMTPF